MWDEEWVQVRKVYIRPSNTGFVSRDNYLDIGVANVSAVIFYFEYGIAPTLDDRVIEVAIDAEGDVIVPYVRNRIYRPETVDPHRSDNGRIEFYSMHCMQKDSIEIAGSPPNAY